MSNDGIWISVQVENCENIISFKEHLNFRGINLYKKDP